MKVICDLRSEEFFFFRLLFSRISMSSSVFNPEMFVYSRNKIALTAPGADSFSST